MKSSENTFFKIFLYWIRCSNEAHNRTTHITPTFQGIVLSYHLAGEVSGILSECRILLGMPFWPPMLHCRDFQRTLAYFNI